MAMNTATESRLILKSACNAVERNNMLAVQERPRDRTIMYLRSFLCFLFSLSVVEHVDASNMPYHNTHTGTVDEAVKPVMPLKARRKPEQPGTFNPFLSLLSRGGGSDSPQATKRRLTGFELALAGSVATMIGDASAHPIDCIKTLQQSTEGAGLSMLGAGKQIFQKNGIGGFYSGLGTYVVSDGCAGAIKFATYEALKQWVNDKIPEEYTGVALFGCAALAFVASSVVLVPGELIKQRLQMGMISSVPEGISTIWKNEGILGFFRGYSGVCLRDIPYTMLELGIYDNLKSIYLKIKNRDAKPGEERGINQLDEIVAAAISGAITGFLTNPLDTIKTKLVVDPNLYSSFADCMRKTVDANGVGALFQGAAARVSWVMPFTTIYLPVYEIFKRRMEQTTIKPVPTTMQPSSSKKRVVKIKGGAQGPIFGTTHGSNKCKARRNRLQRLERDECFVSF